MKRRKIQPGEKLTVRMIERDRTLLLEHTFGDPEFAETLRPASGGGGRAQLRAHVLCPGYRSHL